MKPIVPPNPTRRPGETPREARRPAATGQSPEAAAEGAGCARNGPGQREPEKAKRATEEKRAEERREPEKPRGTEESAEERREPEKPRGTEEKRTGELAANRRSPAGLRRKAAPRRMDFRTCKGISCRQSRLSLRESSCYFRGAKGDI